nr:MAG TPA: hypothetical protein [Caudoviricetes sp.]
MSRVCGQRCVHFRKNVRDHYKSGRTFSYAKSVVKLLHFMTHGQFFL